MVVYASCSKCGKNRMIFTSGLCQECHAYEKMPTPKQIERECKKILADRVGKRTSHGNDCLRESHDKIYVPKVYRSPVRDW